MSSVAPRETCPECLRPREGCVCARVPRVANRTPVYVLQHPRERFHPFGSVRLARMGLARCELDVFGEAFAHLRTWSRAVPPGAALLYPGAGARELGTLAPNERPASLVVIDGTWSQAKNVLKASPELAALPRVMVRPPRPGLYRVRREPALHCMSTLEAIVEALRILEPDTPGLDALVAAFTGMIDAHLELRSRHPHDPFRHVRRPRPAPALPRGLGAGLPSLVVAYAEVLHREGTRELVYLTAHRPAGGESLGLLVRPTRMRPSDFHLGRMGLERGAVDGGVTLEEARAAWKDFLRPGDVVAAWSRSTLDVLGAVVDAEPREVLHLKGVYCNLRRASCGDLVAVAAEHGLGPEPTSLAGRAAERVGLAAAVARAMSEGRIGRS